MSETYDVLVDRAQAAYTSGDLEQAVALFDDAERVARTNGDHVAADVAICRSCYVRFELEDAAPSIALLKQVFLRNLDARTRWMAAYYVAVGCDIAGDLDQALQWADRSSDLAVVLDDPKSEIRCRNLAGILATRRSEFEQAEPAFRRALELQRELDRPQPEFEAQLIDNLGYTLICTQRLSEGLEHCETARSGLAAAGARHLLYETLQDLCYGYILDDQLERAQSCGEEALDLAIEHDDQLIVKNCLFLLSEIAIRSGDTFRARRYLRELTAYYPEIGVSEEIIDVFLQTDLTAVVNLRG